MAGARRPPIKVALKRINLMSTAFELFQLIRDATPEKINQHILKEAVHRHYRAALWENPDGSFDLNIRRLSTEIWIGEVSPEPFALGGSNRGLVAIYMQALAFGHQAAEIQKLADRAYEFLGRTDGHGVLHVKNVKPSLTYEPNSP
jgi:hypothetical protein